MPLRPFTVFRDLYQRALLATGMSTPDLTPTEREIIARARPYTMTSFARLVALVQAVQHVVRSGIPGPIAECGVWRGGSMMAVAGTLLAEGDTTRDLYLYDTFEGMSSPGEQDVDFSGIPAATRFRKASKRKQSWCYASMEDVQANLESTGYPQDRMHFIKGKVENTLPQSAPETLSILRLDTDWYESTRHELECLYPRLEQGGILIIDDYGHWRGARRATDEFFAAQTVRPFLHRIDYTGRLAVKTT
jgi:O-methyltransferase